MFYHIYIVEDSMRSIIITVALVFIVQAAHAEDPCKAHRAKHEESMKGHGMKTDCSNINDDKNSKVFIIRYTLINNRMIFQRKSLLAQICSMTVQLIWDFAG